MPPYDCTNAMLIAFLGKHGLFSTLIQCIREHILSNKKQNEQKIISYN